MKQVLMILCIFTLILSSSAQATLTGDVTGGGSFSDQIATDNGWITESAAGNGVDFWTINANAGDMISIDISALIDFGISVYLGSVMDDLGFAFDNNASFIDPLTTNLGTYVGGTNGVFGEAGSTLNLTLLNSGIHTIAVGGDLGFGSFGPFDYTMKVGVVPETATLFLLLAGIFAFHICRRQTL